jgi:AraC-like DNA-binding protein
MEQVMSQSQQIIQTLKQQLRIYDKTYSDVAQHLNLSEASVKRLFSQQNISLTRLQTICELIGLELLDVMYMARQKRVDINQLTKEQEQALVAQETLMLVLICVFSHWEFTDMLHYYNLSKAELTRLLLILDKMKIIELLPSNNIKLHISSQFDWLPNGPIQHFFQENLLHEFLKVPFKNKGELLLVRNGMLSQGNNILLQREMRKLSEKFLQLNEEDKNSPFSDREGSALFIALRPWVPSIFDKYLLK